MIEGIQTAYLGKIITDSEMARMVLRIQRKYNKDGSLKKQNNNPS